VKGEKEIASSVAVEMTVTTKRSVIGGEKRTAVEVVTDEVFV